MVSAQAGIPIGLAPPGSQAAGRSGEEGGGEGAFEGEQVLLGRAAAAEAAEAVRGQHPVARHDDRDRVARP